MLAAHRQNPPNPSPSLLALKPRQVVLLSSCSTSMAQSQILKPEQRALLLRSIVGFLRRSAFSKTLKKFLPEAQIQEDDSKDSSLDLEVIFCKYLNTCDPSITNTNGDKVQDGREDGKSKKKKKKSEGNDGHPTLSQSEGDDKSTVDFGLQLDASEKKPKEKKKKGKVDTEILEKDAEAENKTKDKKKKKNQPTSESIVQTDEQHVAENVSSEDKNAKSKKKKKKDDSVPAISKDSESQEKELPTLIKCTKGDDKTLNGDVADKESKGSKKRKRKDADENESEISEKAEEESKRRKKEDLKDDEGTKQPVENSASADGYKSAKKESEGNEQNSASQKSANGKSNGSASAKKPFQRVNVEEVEFIDKRLEDNSYWAKDGAETGYGAKAQEVLGQVRGRDFRHEKTKKKRGTYRGGQIDLQSHSVKFQYSDEE